jgi:predicted nucleotidyltransferase component of viral defense system
VIALTKKDVLAHEFVVPWSEPYQVEQDLLLCLAMRAIFEDQFLSHQVAMRGGTVLHKLHLAPAARYSEDIDLVVVGDRPEGHVRKALLRVLRAKLGTELVSYNINEMLATKMRALFQRRKGRDLLALLPE